MPKLTFAPADPDTCDLYLAAPDTLDSTLGQLPDSAADWARRIGFSGAMGQGSLVPDAGGAIALVGLGSDQDRARTRFAAISGAAKLPKGTYQIVSQHAPETLSEIALGWLLGSYRFDRYRSQSAMGAQLVAPDGVDAAGIERLAAGEALTRDLINTPAEDMGPPDLQAAVEGLAERFGAQLDVTEGAALLDANLPLIHTVGRAAVRAPRLIDMRWGASGPTLTLVGKGVCYDTGGLNLKPGASMGLMKKDMGGAANVLGLAQMIMESAWPVRLRVLIPAVENAVAGNAFRPGDIFTARNGMSVEINNTDAEGRLVLADALALGAEEEPDFMVSMATLTGAARVALGPDLAPYYSDDTGFVAALEAASGPAHDPVWRMPFHAPYEGMIEPGIADLDNAPAGGMAGSITAALFLRRFAADVPYAHFDIYGWTPKPGPGRPKGGTGQGPRALLVALPQVLGL